MLSLMPGAKRRKRPKRRFLSTNEVAIQMGVARGKVLGWIHSRELLAVNMASDRTQRPRWAITQKAVNAFVRSRSTEPKRRVDRRRAVKDDDVIEYV